MRGNYRVLTSIIILAVLLWPPSLITAQDKDNWRRKNDVGNRYEGPIAIEQGNPDLELLSFSGHIEPFNSIVDLRVRFFLPSEASVSIIGREIEPQTHFWMEPKPGNYLQRSWNEFYPWPTSTMLRDGITSTNLGVVVFSIPQVGGSKLYLPPLIYHSTLPHSTGGYSLFLRSNKTLSKLTLTVFKYENNREVQVNKWEKNDEKPASTPIRVDMDLSNVPDGIMKLVINRKIKNSTDDAPVHEYRFYHKR